MPPPPVMPMLLSPSLSETESEPETDDSVLLLAAGAQSRLRRRPAVAVHARLLPDSSAPGRTLSCGAQLEVDPALDDWWDARRPASVPFLPLPFDRERTTPPCTRAPRTSTGCGARVHGAAHSTRGGGHWVGYPDGVQRTVVKLEGQYFTEQDRSALGLEVAGCGCVVAGVGCAVCGNALGALHTPCRVHQSRKGQEHYIFLPGAVSPPIKDAGSSRPAGAGAASTSGAAPADENTPPTRALETDSLLWDRPPPIPFRIPRTPPALVRTPPRTTDAGPHLSPVGRQLLEENRAQTHTEAAENPAEAHRTLVNGQVTAALGRDLDGGVSGLSGEDALAAFRGIVEAANRPESTLDATTTAEALAALHNRLVEATNASQAGRSAHPRRPQRPHPSRRSSEWTKTEWTSMNPPTHLMSHPHPKSMPQLLHLHRIQSSCKVIPRSWIRG
ncbi:hypothetical protein K438DRAFT_587588 [Mycena galopus ATCC 62051]|nr:hypothetical protein K438DRAFT_587588 [Mycena galopus ATCC 62051]